MKMSNSFFITRREYPKDEESISAKLLIKSGMIFKNTSGIYSYLPIGLKVLENIKRIVKEEMEKINAFEVLMPSLVDNEVFHHSQKEKLFGKEIFNIKDRNNKILNLVASSEELFTYLASFKIQSYRDLHFSLYQMSNKFRDEEHPEYGLIRKKEFYTLESYSFDADEGGLDVSYDKMFMTFKHIFNRLSIDALVVESDTGDIDGISSEEFQIVSEYGDNEIVKCSNCTYACNLEDASSKTLTTNRDREIMLRARKLVSTPNVKSIKEVSEMLDVFPSNVIKSLICKIDDNYKMILLRGESELNLKKLKKLFKTQNVIIPDIDEVEMLGTSVGYIGPIDCTMEIIADNEIKNMFNFVCGSNKKNYHYINVNYGRDFKINRFADLKKFDNYSLCPKCKNKCSIIKGIEIGQIFKLGPNYSKTYNLEYTDEVNSKQLVHMGSYHIGLDRCINAIVEKNHDENGIIWPLSVAPYKVAIIVSNVNDKDSLKYANSLYDKLNNLGIETLLDDRKETIGVKFNDIDLIGIPIRITVGRELVNNEVEVKLRKENSDKLFKTNVVIDYILDLIKNIS